MPSVAAKEIAATSQEAHIITLAQLRRTPLERADWFLRAIAAAAKPGTDADADADAPAARSAAAPVAGAALAAPPPCASTSAPPACAVLKLESEQCTGSFKARGALWKVWKNATQSGARGFTTASTGNHALATIFAVRAAAAERLAAAAAGAAAAGPDAAPELLVYVSESADATKVARLRAAAADIPSEVARVRVVVAQVADCAGAEGEARRVAEERGFAYISPYNDPDVVAGQGTLAVELLDQLLIDGAAGAAAGATAAAAAPEGAGDGVPPADVGERLAVFVPVGGGGLIAGVAAVLKCALGDEKVRIYGCQPAENDIMARSCEAGAIVDLPAVAAADTLSDATAGGVENGSITFSLCAELVDAWVRLSEREIADAVVSVLEHGGKLVEGAAGCAAAALFKVARENPAELSGRRCVVICCGGNVGGAVLRKVLLEVGARAWDLAV